MSRLTVAQIRAANEGPRMPSAAYVLAIAAEERQRSTALDDAVRVELKSRRDRAAAMKVL